MSATCWDGSRERHGPCSSRSGSSSDRRRTAPAPAASQLDRARAGARFPGAAVLHTDHRQDGPRRLHPAGPLMAQDTLIAPPQGKNRNVAGILFLLAIGMVGMAY